MAEPLKVLVVDDEVPLAGVIASYLQREGFEVRQAHDGPSAVDAAREQQPDVVVLDIMLPGFDGIEVCRQLRQFSDAYVVMLTARDEEVDKIVGLSIGADDYVVKPASPREIIARIRAMLRRPRSSSGAPAGETMEHDVLTVGSLTIDLSARHVRLGDTELDLTRTEFDLLAALAAHPRMAFSRRQLLDEVWGAAWFGDEHVIDVHIAHLRSKLGDDASSPTFIRTVRGIGYGMGTS